MLTPLFLIEKNHVSYLVELPEFAPGFNATEQMGMLAAQTDWQAVLEFLTQYSDNKNTLASYAREVEKFLLWLIHIAKKPISAVNRQDWQHFLAFLTSPNPDWAGPRTPRTIDGKPNPNWRPFCERFEAEPLAKTMNTDAGSFRTALSATSIKLTQKILESFFNFLVENGYLNANPCTVSRSRRKQALPAHSVLDRAIDIELVDEVIDSLYAKQNRTTNKGAQFQLIRARYLIQLLAGTGLRLEEACNHCFGDIRIVKDEWILSIVGKGSKPRQIVIFSDLKALICEYRLAIGLTSPTPLYGEKHVLIPSMRDLTKPLTPRRVDQIMREIFDDFAKEKLYQAQQAHNMQDKGALLHQVSILEKASPHWLRHLHATYYLKHSGDLKSTMDRLGHASVGTSMLYIHNKQSLD